MWPWGHVAVAFLVYTFYTHRRYGRPPEAPALLALAIGSQVPDLLDKPLSWSLGVLPSGRTLGHSVFFALLLIPAVYVLAITVRPDRLEVATAFVGGYLSHLVLDTPHAILTGEIATLASLFWPALEQPPSSQPDSLLDGFLRYSMGAYEWVQLVLFGVALVVWYRDGMPGLEYVRLTRERYSPTDR